MSSNKVVLMPGDGIGPEITEACLEIIEASGAKIEWLRAQAGQESLKVCNQVVPEATMELIGKIGVAYKGPLATPIGGGHSSANVLLRKRFKMFANVRPSKTVAGIPCRYQNVDLVVVRENTEDLYSGIEHEVVPGVVESLKIITADASERVSRFTFEYCRRMNRKRVTAVHKANIMKMSDGLFLKSAQKIRAEYPDIQYDEIIVDNACHQLVMRPEKFDVLLTTNLYGDIVSDLCAGLVGGLGVVPAANYGENCALFEAVHGTGPDIAGRGIANPTAMLLSGCLMLDHLGLQAQSQKIQKALNAVFSRGGKDLTQDLGGAATTKSFAQTIIREMK